MSSKEHKNKYVTLNFHVHNMKISVLNHHLFQKLKTKFTHLLDILILPSHDFSQQVKINYGVSENKL